MILRPKISNCAVASLILLICGVASAFSATNAEFNVATYNIRQLNESDSIHGDVWSRRCQMIADIVRFHEFNIFGTQEGFKSQLEDLKSKLPAYDYIGVAREDGKSKGEHSAIFYDTELFDLIDHGDFWLSETPDHPGLGWDAACVRICSWGKFRHKPSGKIFQFFNLHLDHVGEKAREESVLLVQRKMREIGLDLPTFLTGDFNVDQNHHLYEVMSSSDFLQDSFCVSDLVYAPNGTFNDYKTDGFSTSRIDHIFVTPDINVEKYGILTDTYRTLEDNALMTQASDSSEEVEKQHWKCRVPSDHFPVKVKVKIN